MKNTRRYLGVVFAVASTWAAWCQASDDPRVVAEKERELIALLMSEAEPGEKAVACKMLAIYGSEAAVPELARLLPDERLASWARIALEAIPGPAPDAALRKAVDSLQGNLLIGVINSIGVRRDAAAVDVLKGRLDDPEIDVAASAAVALGRIGAPGAADALLKVLGANPLALRSAVAEGLVLCAERAAAEGRESDAIKLYDAVRAADVPRQRKLEATRGAMLSRGAGGLPLLVEQLRSPDKAFAQIALSTAREMKGNEVAETLIAEISVAAPDRAALILQTLADRRDTAVQTEVLRFASSGPKPVRLAALAAVSRLGDASSLSKLLDLALDNDPELARAAKSALSSLPGEKVDEGIVARLARAEGKQYPVLLELVGERRINALDALLKAVEHRDAGVRGAALSALGATVDAKGIPVLIAHVVTPRTAEDAAAAQQALRVAAIRMPDREACAEQLAGALGRSKPDVKIALLKILGEMGGAKALDVIGAAARSDDPQLQDAATRLLGEWMNVDAAGVLLELARPGANHRHQVRALRGYIRLARQFAMPDSQRADMCAKALEAANQPAEQKLVLDVLKRYPSLETLKLAIKAMQTADLREEATAAAMLITQKLGSKVPEARELLAKAGLPSVKLEIVKAEYGAGSNLRDVTEALRKLAGDLPMISLPSPSFNASLGGDPAPGTPKQLKISYKINGKAAEAAFAEDAVIVLPMPK